MELLLNMILNLTQEEIKNSKIQFSNTEGPSGTPYIDKWLKLDENQKRLGICPQCSFWGWKDGKQRNFSPGQWCFSFIKLTGDEWLLVSAGEIIEVPKGTWAKVDVIKERFAPLFGRLVIKRKKKNSFGAYTFNIDTYLEEDSVVVKEILPCIYSGEQFEGYDKVHLPYRRLADIFDGKIMPTYYEALKKITGVYCLTDTSNGKLYIGSATGSEGVAQRWGSYLDSKHGGNVKLVELFNEEGAEYFEKKFTFTLLEYFGLSYDPNKIIEREQYWKKCLDTKYPHGYNDN